MQGLGPRAQGFRALGFRVLRGLGFRVLGPCTLKFNKLKDQSTEALITSLPLT